MRTSPDCVPCLVRQALDAARLTSTDTRVHEAIVRDTLASLSEADLGRSPPALAQRIHRRLREVTGVTDAYQAAKEGQNRLALGLLTEFRSRVTMSDDPFALAVSIAIAGNVIDMGPTGDLTDRAVHRALERALGRAVHGPVDELRAAAERAERILYLADNAGEIVLDRILIERLGPARVTVAARGAPILNDATMRDAHTAGLDDIVEVIDNGSDAPGTILGECSTAFRERFARASLIVAKGQGNFESLSAVRAPVYFLFVVKCPLVAARVGLPVGTPVVVHRGVHLRRAPGPGSWHSGDPASIAACGA
jgi:uncharacterized protein with ATP-grasp and redox domains